MILAEPCLSVCCGHHQVSSMVECFFGGPHCRYSLDGSNDLDTLQGTRWLEFLNSIIPMEQASMRLNKLASELHRFIHKGRLAANKRIERIVAASEVQKTEILSR